MKALQVAFADNNKSISKKSVKTGKNMLNQKKDDMQGYRLVPVYFD